MDDRDVRTKVVSLLEEKGYVVTNAASGSGVPAWSRVTMEKDGKTFSAAIKVTSSGRIRFARRSDGSYDVLNDVDLVVHALRDRELARIDVSMYDRQTILDAFEENFASLVRTGQEGTAQQWLNPDFEPGPRYAGSGFGKKAIWSEAIAVAPLGAAAGSDEPASGEPGIMDQIKLMLAKHMNVDPKMIEIDVRVKL